MQVSREIDITSYRIHSYAEGAVTVTVPRHLHTTPETSADIAVVDDTVVRRQTLHHSLVIMPERLITDWPPQSYDELDRSHFDMLADQRLEVLLVGTGARLRWPSASILAGVMDAGFGIEVMDTGAACRTYNILMSDQRRVAAALLMI